ncbi:alpha/beta hydrolase [Rubellicoccus peritrichatus]|uniref:Alpha/beta hydrolase-fold protein n=1 Tax=Rubellicoccus peritrichatus TaxID=3080537 RepID=A0AAQ3LBU4_9BACT|nr:alpha/beta hydrolase-fold protein [Puniceicoccus sp. CR14]WOO40618.1 alpha/beta hydrolase-fold protein [Puniceicoccus sp. CR14]
MVDCRASYFRTTEVGDIPCERGMLRLVTVKSPALKARADLSIYIPQQAEGRTDLPVVTLLHGVYGSHWIWSLMGKAHMTLQRLIDVGEVPPMLLVMPSDGLWGDGSGYVPHIDKDFEAWISQDVPQAVSENVGNDIDAPHFIGGLSMGGFGALRLGAKYHDRYKAFAGHSSITSLDQMPLFVEEPMEAYPAVEGIDRNVVDAILANCDSIGPFRFDCGVDDLLIKHNRTLAKALGDAGVEFTYQEFPGGHEWSYWETHVVKTFKFFAEQL